MKSQIVLDSRIWNKWYIISICGSFAVKNILPIKASFEKAEASSHFIALDLNETIYMDSSAITILLNFHKRCVEKGGNLVLLGLNQDIQEIISIVGIDKIITVKNSTHDLQKD